MIAIAVAVAAEVDVVVVCIVNVVVVAGPAVLFCYGRCCLLFGWCCSS